MKINNNEIKSHKIFAMFVFLYCLCIVYVIPVSSNLNLDSSIHGDIYSIMRLGIVIPTLVSFVIIPKKPVSNIIEYISLLTLLISSWIIKGEFQGTSLFVLISIVLLDTLNKIHITLDKTLKRLVHIITICFVCQLMVMSTYFYTQNGFWGIIGSFKDANYTSYFLILLYFLNGDEKVTNIIQKRDILLFLSILTYSRTALIVVGLIVLIRLLHIGKKIRLKHIYLTYFMFFTIWMIICNLYIKYFNGFNYIYEYRTGFDRFSNIVDESNYIRTLVNVQVLEYTSLKSFFLGFSNFEYNSLINFNDKMIYPHNLFLSIFSKSGFFFSIALVKRLCSIFANNKFDNLAFFIAIVLFSNILGPSFYYGIDLIIILYAVRFQKEDQGEQNGKN